jgi:hypothetical protein
MLHTQTVLYISVLLVVSRDPIPSNLKGRVSSKKAPHCIQFVERALARELEKDSRGYSGQRPDKAVEATQANPWWGRRSEEGNTRSATEAAAWA